MVILMLMVVIACNWGRGGGGVFHRFQEMKGVDEASVGSGELLMKQRRRRRRVTEIDVATVYVEGI
jgi:hypothetical protein